MGETATDGEVCMFCGKACDIHGAYWKTFSPRKERKLAHESKSFEFSEDHKVNANVPKKKNYKAKPLTEEQKQKNKERNDLKRSQEKAKKAEETER